MSIARTLALSVFLLGTTLPALAASDGTDSHCVIGKDNTLFNQCSYSVDVGFCVENPRQTKNFFDGSDAFECPNGGLSTLGPGKKEGNILHGTVHWWACSTKHRGTGRWRYVQGRGYRGYCVSEQETKAGNAAPSPRTRASAQECSALQQRATQASGTGADRVHNYTMIEYLDRGCGKLTPEDREATRKIYQQEYVRLVSECRHSGARNCDSAAMSNEAATPARPAVQTPPSAPSGNVSAARAPARSEPSVDMLMSRCSDALKTAIDTFYQSEVDGDRYYRRNHTGSRERVQGWMTEKARGEYAAGTLAIPPQSLAEYHAGALQEAASRTRPMGNGLHDPHRELALLRACFMKARMDSR
ncbi:MAG: hypothetical protein V4645_04635 [Pseudomonadota bacterium]